MNKNIFKKIVFSLSPVVITIMPSVVISCKGNNEKTQNINEKNKEIVPNVVPDNENTNKDETNKKEEKETPSPKKKQEKSQAQKDLYNDFVKVFDYKKNSQFSNLQNIQSNKNALEIFNRTKNILKQLNDIYSENYDYYENSADKEFYRLSLKTFLNEQAKASKNDQDLKTGKQMHFIYLLNFLNNANVVSINRFGSMRNQLQSANAILDEVQKFIDYQLKNKDLVFDAADKYQLKSDEELLYVKEAASSDIKEVRKQILKNGYLTVNFDSNNSSTNELKQEREKYYKSVYETLNSQFRVNTQSNIYAAFYKLSSDYFGWWGFFSSLADSYDESLMDWLLINPEYFNSYGLYNTNMYNKFLSLDRANNQYKITAINSPNRYRKNEYPAIKKMVAENLPKIISHKFTTEQKVRAISNWIMHRLKYAWREFAADKNASNWNIRNPYALTEEAGYFVKGKGVCESYARLFLLFTTFADIKASYVTGFANEPHAWNNVYDEESQTWKYVDLTWTDNSDYELAKLQFNNPSPFLSDKVTPYFYDRNLIFKDWLTIARNDKGYIRNISLSIRFTKWVRSLYKSQNDFYTLPDFRDELRMRRIDYFTPYEYARKYM